MDSLEIMEHPYVTRVKAMMNPPQSPTIRIRDTFQPSQGSLLRIANCIGHRGEVTQYTN